MKRRWIEYRERWDRMSPMAFWVHLPTDSKPWFDATEFDPPPPPPVPGKGFPVYFVEFDGFVFRFSSLSELAVCISVLEQKNLPNVKSEWTGRTGACSHWLNKLPGHVLPWAYRQRAVEYLRESHEDFATTARTRPTTQIDDRRGQKREDC